MYKLKITWNDGSTQHIETEEEPQFWQNPEGYPLAFELRDGVTINLQLVRKWQLLDPSGVPVFMYGR